jgi:Protein of unknown function (DUF3800)
MTFLLFLDESGDHGLHKIDIGFPVFVLGGILVEVENYEYISMKVNYLKKHLWGTSDVILHSSDIRKQQKAFSILRDPQKRVDFYESINMIFQNSPYQIFATVVDKPKYLTAFGKLEDDIYKIALSHIVEQVVLFLNEKNTNSTENLKLKVIIEKRGKREDKSLATYFQKILSLGTGLFSKKDLDKWRIEFDFDDKKENTVGLQLADLVIYPIARVALNNSNANPAYEILKSKIDGKYGLRKLP